MDLKLKPFQRAFERAVESPEYDTVAISGPRSLGKTYMLARILTRCLTPGDVLHQPGKEYILGSATLAQARQVYGFIRQWLEPTGAYRWIDSTTRLGATHVATNTKLTAISSNAKSSFGLVNVPLLCLDEPGALEIVGGQMLADSLFTAQGKVGSRLKVCMAGTLGPSAVSSGHWWWDLIHAGTTPLVHVQHFHGQLEGWDVIRRANPLVMVDAHTRKVILAEPDAARKDTRLKARFLTYRLNVPTADESTVLLTTDDWLRTLDRPVPDRVGKPVVAVDLGWGRAWSAAVAMWRNGRTEALAVAPGIPDLQAQERRDIQPAGTYRRLQEQGSLMVAEGLRVQPPAQLVAAIRSRWGRPESLTCDYFRLRHLEDSLGGIPAESRRTLWSNASEDVGAVRKFAKDGPMAVAADSRGLLTASLSAALVQNDSSGNTRMVKDGSNNQSRDDVAAALVLCCGALARMLDRPRAAWRSRGLV